MHYNIIMYNMKNEQILRSAKIELLKRFITK